MCVYVCVWPFVCVCMCVCLCLSLCYPFHARVNLSFDRWLNRLIHFTWNNRRTPSNSAYFPRRWHFIKCWKKNREWRHISRLKKTNVFFRVLFFCLFGFFWQKDIVWLPQKDVSYKCTEREELWNQPSQMNMSRHFDFIANSISNPNGFHGHTLFLLGQFHWKILM